MPLCFIPEVPSSSHFTAAGLTGLASIPPPPPFAGYKNINQKHKTSSFFYFLNTGGVFWWVV